MRCVQKVLVHLSSSSLSPRLVRSAALSSVAATGVSMDDATLERSARRPALGPASLVLAPPPAEQ